MPVVMSAEYVFSERLKSNRTFAGLPTFAPITFHLFVSYSLIALRRAWLYESSEIYRRW